MLERDELKKRYPVLELGEGDMKKVDLEAAEYEDLWKVQQ